MQKPNVGLRLDIPVLLKKCGLDNLGIGVGGGGGGGRGAAAPPNSGKQWGKFGQTVGEIRAKQEEKIGQRKLQINPFGIWMMTSHRQCSKGGGCLWLSV